MHGADRVLLVQSDLDNDIKVHYLVLPVRFMKSFLFLHLYLTTKLRLKVSQHSVSFKPCVCSAVSLNDNRSLSVLFLS